MTDWSRHAPAIGRTRRLAYFTSVVFAGVALFAGIAGIVLLAVPGSTGRFFSWALTPEALASSVGGLYVGSSAAFALALGRSWLAVRGLVLGSIAFTVPTFIATLAHLDVFDFGRLLAWAWVIIFGVAPIVFATMIVLRGNGHWHEHKGRVPRWAGVLLLPLALGFSAGAAHLWIDPMGAGGWLPFDPSPMGGRFLGAWMALIAFLLTWAALRPAAEGWVPLAGVASLIVGAVLGAVRAFDMLEPASRAFYVGVLSLIAGASFALLRLSRRSPD